MATDNASLLSYDDLVGYPVRLHSARGYVSPDQFERRYRLSKTREKTTAA